MKRKPNHIDRAPGTGQTRREFTRKLAVAGAGLPLVGSLIPVSAVDAAPYQRAGTCAGSWKINLFSKHLQFLGYDEMAEASVVAGLDGLDLTVRPGGHVLPENVEKDMPLAAKAIRKAGLELTMMTTRITDPDDPATGKILKVASDLGIRYYRMGYYNYDKEVGVVKSLETIRDKMSRLAIMNEKYGLHGAYQNHAGTRFGAPLWDLWHVIHDQNPKWIGCQYDIRHAVVEGAQSWPLGMELLKDHIKCMAIKDFIWSQQDGRWRIKNVPVGEGMVDFGEYFKLVKAYQITGPISLHIEYPLYPDKNISTEDKKASAIRTIQHDVQSLKGLLPS